MFVINWFSSLFLVAETTSALGTLRDMKNLNRGTIIGLHCTHTRIENFKKLKPQEVIDDLDPTENGEAGEETHCASDQSKLSLRCHLGVGVDLDVTFHL